MYFWISTIKGKYEYVGAISVKIRCPLHVSPFSTLPCNMAKAKIKAAPKPPKAKAASKARALLVVPEAATTIEKQDIEEMNQSVAYKRSRSRSLEEAVAKCLRDNFPTWTAQETDLTLRQGVSLRQHILKDKMTNQSKTTNIKFGKTYFDLLKEQWSSPDLAWNKIVVVDPLEPEDPALNTALVGIVSHRKDYAPLLEYLMHAVRPNQKVLCCIYKTCLKYIKPMSSQEQCTIVLELMRFVARLDLKDAFPREFDIMKKIFDTACCKSASTFKANGVSSFAWWTRHKEIAELLLPSAALEKCMNNKSESWSALETELLEVVTACELGERLFLKASQTILRQRLTLCSVETVATLRGKAVARDDIETAKQVLETKLNALGCQGTVTFAPRATKVTYRGAKLDIMVVSYNDEFQAHLQAFLRSVAVDTKNLPALWFEDELVGAHVTAPGTLVHDQLIGSFRTARDTAINMATTDGLSSGDALVAMLQKKRQFLTSIDKYFSIEISFFSSCVGESASLRLQDEMLLCLPTRANCLTVDESMTALRAMERGKLLEFAGLGPAGIFTAVLKHIKAIQDKRVPMWQTGSGFMAKVKAQSSLFVKFEAATSAGATPETFYGVKAVAAIYAKVTATKLTTAIGYDALTPLVVFGWLLKPCEQLIVKGWTNEILGALGGKSNEKPDAKEPSSKKMKGKADAKALVAALYK
jgi:hypothetical protein